jgi:exosome complex component CSL4
MVESEELVLPGMEVGYAEEFIPGEGTYEEDGKIYASITGTLKIDLKERKMSVEPKTSSPAVPKKGDIIVGTIVDIKPQFAIVDILKIKGVDRELSGSVSGSIHISKTKDSYVPDLSKEFGHGDIILARIIDTDRTPLALSTVEKELGVIKGYCSQCNMPLLKINNKLKCSNCNQIVYRKISSEYGKGTL